VKLNTSECYTANSEAAERIARYVNQIKGLEASTASSGKSASAYVYVYDESNREYKVRIANHELPDRYASPHTSITASDWKSAIIKIAKFFGAAVSREFTAQVKRESTRQASAKAKQDRRVAEFRARRITTLQQAADGKIEATETSKRNFYLPNYVKVPRCGSLPKSARMMLSGDAQKFDI